MMNPIRSCGILLALILLSTGCAKPYVPQLSLGESPRTIDANVEFHSLYPSPKAISGRETYGVLASDVKTAGPTELTDQIATALLNDLAANHVFRRIGTFDPQPDYVLTGRINKFYEHYREKLWTFLPWANKLRWLFRMNTYVSSGEVDLTIILLKTHGQGMRRYTARKAFNEDFVPTDEMRPGTRLNRAFADAVEQIRDELLADPHLAA